MSDRRSSQIAVDNPVGQNVRKEKDDEAHALAIRDFADNRRENIRRI